MSIKETLSQVAQDAPASLPRPEQDWAKEAWSAGRGRRRRSQIIGGALALAVVVLVGFVLAPLVWRPVAAVPASGDSRPAVSAYPQRIGHQWWVRSLPDTPGPMAAIIRVDQSNEGEPGQWQIVDSHGTRYSMGAEDVDIFPSISADGTLVSYFDTERQNYVIRDLVAGSVTSFPDLGLAYSTRGESPPRRGYLNLQTPVFASPADDAVAVSARTGNDSGAFVLGTDGTITRAGELDRIVGWLDADRVVGEITTETGATGANSLPLYTWDRRTGHLAPLVTLTQPQNWDQDPLFGSQWSVQLRPDGRFVASTDGLSGSRVFVTYDQQGRIIPPDGSTGVSYEYSGQGSATCPMSWRGTEVVVSMTSWTQSGFGIGTEPAPRMVTAIASDSMTRCLIYAADALAGHASFTLWGTADWWFAWWWKEIFTGIAASYALWRWSRRATMRRYPLGYGRRESS